MKAIVKLGGLIELEIDERNEMDTLHKAIVLSNYPKKCFLCGEPTYLTSNKDKEGNTYVNARCSKCGAVAKLGLYKSGGFFWHKFEKYQKPQTTTHTTPDNKEVPEDLGPDNW